MLRHIAKEGQRNVVIIGQHIAAGNHLLRSLRALGRRRANLLRQGQAEKQAHISLRIT